MNYNIGMFFSHTVKKIKGVRAQRLVHANLITDASNFLTRTDKTLKALENYTSEENSPEKNILPGILRACRNVKN